MISQRFEKEVYPDNFNEDDIIEFDILLAQSKIIYPKIEDWMLKIAIIGHIYEEKKGIKIEKNSEELEELEKIYKGEQGEIIQTPYDEEFYKNLEEIQKKNVIYVESNKND